MNHGSCTTRIVAMLCVALCLVPTLQSGDARSRGSRRPPLELIREAEKKGTKTFAGKSKAQTPDSYLKALVLHITGTRGLNRARANARMPINRIAASAEVFGKFKGVDSSRALLVFQDQGKTWVILREQARASGHEREREGRPGGRSFRWGDSFSGSLTLTKKGRVESLSKHRRVEAREELGLDLRESRFTQETLIKGLAVDPRWSTEVATLALVISNEPVKVDDDAVAKATADGGEAAESGARTGRFEISDAIAMLQAGGVEAACLALLLYDYAHKKKIPLEPSLSKPLPEKQRQQLRKLLDLDRQGILRSDYSRLSTQPNGEWTGNTLSLRSRRITLSSADGRRIEDENDHVVASVPDQVSEMPMLRHVDGTLYVGLVPSVSAGIAARETPAFRDKRGVKARVSTVQERGMIGDVERYAESRDNGGNLGVVPVYDREAERWQQILQRLGLRMADHADNLGQYNASIGPHVFHTNLMVREVTLFEGASIESVNELGAIKLMPLDDAIRYMQTYPGRVDLMTQVQLYTIALREQGGVSKKSGFRFKKSR